MTILEKFNFEFTGGNSASLPIQAHYAGVDGVNNRWLSKLAPAGTTGTFAAVKGGLVLSSEGSAPTRTTDENGVPIMRFDGVDDRLRLSGLSGFSTITLVARVNGSTDGTFDGIVHTGPTHASRHSSVSTQARLVYAGASPVYPSTGNTTGPKYHVITLVRTATEGRWGIDSLTGTITGGSSTLHSEITLGRAAGTDYGAVDILEVLTWPTALSVGQMGLVYAALKEHYGSATVN